MASYSAIITSGEVIIAEGQLFKMVASHLTLFCQMNVSKEEINFMKENAIPRNANYATKFGMALGLACIVAIVGINR